jgi:hypothetical protein
MCHKENLNSQTEKGECCLVALRELKVFVHNGYRRFQLHCPKKEAEVEQDRIKITCK